VQRLSLALLCLVLACSSMSCTPKLLGPTASGRYFFLLVGDPSINLARVSELFVHVRNAQGQPLDGVPVTFEVEPAWAQSATIVPQQALTQGGIARAIFQARTTGSARVIVRVDNLAQEGRISISAYPSAPAE
jgi:hypothetical protein